jgi:hypothetical protein
MPLRGKMSCFARPADLRQYLKGHSPSCSLPSAPYPDGGGGLCLTVLEDSMAKNALKTGLMTIVGCITAVQISQN